jgi:hypothetical protein
MPCPNFDFLLKVKVLQRHLCLVHSWLTGAPIPIDGSAYSSPKGLLPASAKRGEIV